MNRIKKHIILLLSFLLFLPLISTCGIAVSMDSFAVKSFSPEKTSEIWNSLNLQALDSSLNNSPITDSILNFDVSDAGIVLALEGNKIAVLDLEGNIRRCFSFNMAGTYGVHWNDKNIVLFQTRGDLIFEFTLDAQPVHIVQMDQSSIENYQLRDKLTDNQQISFGSYSYQIKNTSKLTNILASQSYSQLVKTDATGKEELILDVGRNQTAIILGTIIVLFTIAFSIAIVFLIKKKRNPL